MALAGAQFIMVLDQSVMNVSISQLVVDFNTTVTTIQAVITLYCLVMAMLMLTGGKIGDIIGRRRAFVIGLVIYACGSGLTAVSQTVAAADPRLVDPRGDRRRPRAAGHGRADRRQLRGEGAQGRLRRSSAASPALASRSAPSSVAGPRPSSRWRDRVRRRGRDRHRDPRHDPVRRRRAAHRTEAPSRRRRLHPRGHGTRSGRPGHPAVQHLGPDRAQGFAGDAIRPLADAVRHRAGRHPAVGLRGLAAAPRGGRAATRWCTSTCEDPAAAGRA